MSDQEKHMQRIMEQFEGTNQDLVQWGPEISDEDVRKEAVQRLVLEWRQKIQSMIEAKSSHEWRGWATDVDLSDRTHGSSR